MAWSETGDSPFGEQIVRLFLAPVCKKNGLENCESESNRCTLKRLQES